MTNPISAQRMNLLRSKDLKAARRKQAVNLIVYRPAGGAGQQKAGASGWAVNRSTQDATGSAVSGPCASGVVFLTVRLAP
jgi:hypothetical protein